MYGECALVGIPILRKMIFKVGIEQDSHTMVSALKACADAGNITIRNDGIEVNSISLVSIM